MDAKKRTELSKALEDYTAKIKFEAMHGYDYENVARQWLSEGADKYGYKYAEMTIGEFERLSSDG